MYLKTIITKLALILSVSLVLPVSQLKAHPHNWINLKSEFILDENGMLQEIRQEWEFDVFYSMISLADLMNEHGNEQKGLKYLAEDMITNLANHNYFSKLNIAGENIPIPKPKDYRMSTALFEGQKLITLHANFVLPQALQIENKTLIWQVYDPTYYIDMSHHVESQVLIQSGNANECSKQIEFAEPSDEMIDYASSLDRTQRDTGGLGILFAEKVIINCI